MKKYNKTIAKIIKIFAENGLKSEEINSKNKIENYFLYITVAVVLQEESNNPQYDLNDEMKAILVCTIKKQWELFKETKAGKNLIEFYKYKEKMNNIFKDSSHLEDFLKTITNKKMIEELFLGFVKIGDLESIKKIVNSSVKYKIDINSCVLAVEYNQPDILEYLINRDLYQVSNIKTYLNIYAKKAIEYNSQEVFSSIIKRGSDIDIDSLLSHAVFYNYEKFAHQLIDMGANLKIEDTRIDKKFLEEITSYYNKKLLHNNLQLTLNDKQMKKSIKI